MTCAGQYGRAGERAVRTTVGALLGTCGVAFLVLAGLFVRDLALSGQICTADTRDQRTGIALLQFCFGQTPTAAQRLR